MVLVLELRHEVLFDGDLLISVMLDVIKRREHVKLENDDHDNVVAVEVDSMLEPFRKEFIYL